MASPFKLRARIEIEIDHYFAKDEEEAIESFRELLKTRFPENSIKKLNIEVDDE